MFTILHSGVRYSVPVKNVEDFQGFWDPNNAISTAYLLSLVEGRIVAIDTDGTIKLADGNTDTPVGFLVKGFTAYDLNSMTTPSDGGISVSVGSQVVRTDQIDTAVTIEPGDKLYAGTGAAVGLLTNVAPAATSKVVGIARSSASAAAPTLELIFF